MRNDFTRQQSLSIFKCITLSALLCFLMLSAQLTKAQNAYKVDRDSQIRFSVDSSQNITSTNNAVNAEGTFTLRNGNLDDISAFNIVLPIYKLSAQDDVTDSISFKLTHVMVLPVMKMIHTVGILNVAGVSTRTDIEFSFVINADQSITLKGAKKIKLSDYSPETTTKLAAYIPEKELKLNMDLVFRNQQPTMYSAK